MRVILGDAAARLLADGEATSLVTARILKSAFLASRALMALPPCFPVAPVISSARDILVVVEYVTVLDQFILLNR